MNMSALIVLSLFASISHGLSNVPSFKWHANRLSNSGVPILIMRLPGSSSEDHIHLENYDPLPNQPKERAADIDQCIFRGTLENDNGTKIALAGGCPFGKKFEIQINGNESLSGLFSFQNGKVERVSSPFSRSRSEVDGNQTHDIAMEVPKEHQSPKPRVLSNKQLPKAGFNINLNVVYDKKFEAKFGNDSQNAVRRVMAFAQGKYKWASLTTNVIFNIQSISLIPINLTKGADIESLQIVAKSTNNSKAHTNIGLTFQNNEPGVVGLSYVGTVCIKNNSYKSSVSEWYKSDGITGEIVAHELGHSLGMNHDFNGNQVSSARFDSKNRICTNISSIMDYFQPEVNKWSTCSVEDFTAYYNDNQPFCLPLATSQPLKQTLTSKQQTTTTKAPQLSNKLPVKIAQSEVGNNCAQYRNSACQTICAHVNYDPKYGCSIKAVNLKCPCNFFEPIVHVLVHKV